MARSREFMTQLQRLEHRDWSDERRTCSRTAVSWSGRRTSNGVAPNAPLLHSAWGGRKILGLAAVSLVVRSVHLRLARPTRSARPAPARVGDDEMRSDAAIE